MMLLGIEKKQCKTISRKRLMDSSAYLNFIQVVN